MYAIAKLKTAGERIIWGDDLNSVPLWKAWLLKTIRMAFVIIREILEGQLTLRAMSLVFTTLLSLVPLLAVSFSVLKAFGVHNQVEPLLLNVLEPLGAKGVEITQQIIGFVDNAKVGVLGSLGIGLLIYTAVSMIQKVEAAFNYTWHVGTSRSFAKRFSNYLSVIIIGPVLIFSALGVTATVMSTSFVQTLVAMEPFGSLYRFLTLMLPFMLVIVAFAFTYIFIPNTQVRLLAALVGGTVGGVLWTITGKLFATFVMASTKYTAIYSGFAIVLLFMIWVYVSWLVMLVGASVAFYIQHPEYLVYKRQAMHFSNHMKESLALTLLTMVGQHYYHNQPPWTMEELAQRLRVTSQSIAELLEILVSNDILSRTDSDPPTYIPACPLECLTVKRVLDVVRAANEPYHTHTLSAMSVGDVNRIMSELDRAVDKALAGKTIKDLAVVAPESVVAAVKTIPQAVSSSTHGVDG
jgi:membrane protein